MKKVIKGFFKQIFFFLQLFDGLWSVPLGFFVFFFVGLLLSSAFGMAVGQYDLAFIQPLFLAGTVVVGATNMANMGLYFTNRRLFHYLYGYKNKETGQIVNLSKTDWDNSPSIFKLCASSFILLFFIVAILKVFLSLV